MLRRYQAVLYVASRSEPCWEPRILRSFKTPERARRFIRAYLDARPALVTRAGPRRREDHGEVWDVKRDGREGVLSYEEGAEVLVQSVGERGVW